MFCGVDKVCLIGAMRAQEEENLDVLYIVNGEFYMLFVWSTF
jgi:hypothetical protein